MRASRGFRERQFGPDGASTIQEARRSSASPLSTQPVWQRGAGLETSHAIYLETRAFGSLDGLRALSIMAVVWLHTVVSPPTLPALSRGFLGVDFFFVISGFLIATLLLRERRRTGDVSLRGFYARRTLRIVPAYWVMLAVALGVAYLKPGEQSANIKHDIPYALLYVSNFVLTPSFLSITWSLSTEEQFYLVIPWLQKYAPRLFARFILPLGYLLVVLPPFGFFPGIHLPEFFRQTTFGPILLGVMLAYVLDSPRGWRCVAKFLASPYSPVCAFVVLALVVNFPASDVSGWPRLAMQVAMLFLLASCVVRERHMLVGALRWWPLRRIGVVSYGIYLYHLLIYWPVARLLALLEIRSDYVFFILVLLCSWCVAEVSYRVFEARFLNLKKRFVVRTDVAAQTSV